MVRNQRDEIGDHNKIAPSFTITNREVITSLDADITTATVQNNAIAAIKQALLDQGIMPGTVS